MVYLTPDPDRAAVAGLPDVRAAATDASGERLSLVADIATRLLMHERPEEIAPEIYARLAAHLNLDVFFNYLIEEDGSGMRLASWDGVPEPVVAAISHLHFGQAACGTVALLRTPIIAANVQQSTDPIFGVLRTIGVRAYACHPLIARQELIGTLAFASRTRDEFAEDEIALMAMVANQASIAIERGRLLLSYAQEQAARHSAESNLVKALQDSETRLRTVLDILPVGVFIADETGRVVVVNRAGQRIWGNPPLAASEEAFSAYRGRWAATGQPVAPGDWGLPRAIRGEEPVDREIDIEAFDGQRRTILNSALPIKDARGLIVGGVAVDVDITGRKRAEEVVRRSEAILSQAGEMAALGAWELEFQDASNVEANPLRWSDQVYRLFGYEPGEVEISNELFFAHVHPDDRQRVQDAVARALAERRSYSIEHRIVRRDGVERVVFEHADITFDADGRPLRMIGAVQDVTERKRAEEALREADRRKNEFLATLSHELRNPLAPIRYALELMDAPGNGNGSASRPRDVIERQLRHLVRLVDDLLDVTRITSNKVRLRRRRVNLQAVLGHALEAADPEIKGAQHELIVNVPREPIWLEADPDRLAQVITNLLNNAARYTPSGGRITVTATDAGPAVTLSVADNGIGLDPGDLRRVFEMFAQAGEPGRGGLGIGLALVKALVEMHGGTVQAESAGPGHGSEFRVRLPRGRVQHGERHPESAGKAVPLGARRVLVVDDNLDAAEMAALLLRLRGHEVRVAPDAAAALAVAQEFRPDVGLFDIGLPGMNGYELARRVRANRDLGLMYLVAVTGWGQEEDRRRAREAGFDAHLTKPADPEAIERAIANSVRRDA